MRPLHLRLPAALAIVLTLAGCGLSDPYTSQHPATTSTSTSAISTTTTATVPNADPAPERGGTIPNAAHAAQNKLAAAPACRRRRRRSSATPTSTSTGPPTPSPAYQTQLAAISVGQARAQALQAAASYGHDSTLQASQVANTGTVVAIAPGQGSAAGWWVIVTRETTTGRATTPGCRLPTTSPTLKSSTPSTDSL